jgi:penicillin-insensitive murein DD-endopeptidase
MRVWMLILALLALPAQAETTAATLFSAKRAPTSGPPSPVGTYNRGCAAGNVELPESGPTWQAMRLSRDRNWGQPVLVDYLEDLSQKVTAAGWKGIYIGDLGNPRGGPMNSGHASHQMGLDADIWFLKPDRLDLSRKEREKISSISIRSDDQLSVNGNWDPSYREMLKAAASDQRVDRIFVAAAIKIEMCKTATAADAKWLQHIRPEANHADHLHVRLKCPAGSALCQTQKPTVDELSKGGSGCDDTLMYWVSDAYLHPKPPKNPAPPKPHKRTSREYLMSDLPEQCAAVLSAE